MELILGLVAAIAAAVGGVIGALAAAMATRSKSRREDSQQAFENQQKVFDAVVLRQERQSGEFRAAILEAGERIDNLVTLNSKCEQENARMKERHARLEASTKDRQTRTDATIKDLRDTISVMRTAIDILEQRAKEHLSDPDIPRSLLLPPNHIRVVDPESPPEGE